MGVKVHVTGGKGFLGQHVCAALEGAEAEFEVELTDVDTLDVTDQEATLEALGRSKPDVVVHLAGLMGAGASLADPRRFFEVNCVGTLNVLEACRRAGIGGFVFMSSLTVHGVSEAGAVDEGSAYAPRHPYAGSKAAAEVVVETYARCYGLRAAILRATLIAGEGQAEPNAVGDFVEAVLSGEAIDIYGDGRHRREWLHPLDLAAAVGTAVAHVAGGGEPGCETMIVSSGEPISMAALAERVIARTGKGELTFTPSNRQAFDLISDSERMRRLGWSPARSIDDIIDEYVAARRPVAGGEPG